MKISEKLANMGAKFYIYAGHLDFKAVEEVSCKSRDIVKEAISEGLSFIDIEKDFVVLSKGEYSFEKDSFAKLLKNLWQLSPRDK